ncbi:MAG: YjbQ family protein [Methylobacteriaceae bacterium]|nr:YjbQ family protein [Methylobacteriaceae bacterium]
MWQAQDHVAIKTSGKGLTDVTEKARSFLAGHPCRAGLMTIFCRHTSASLLIQENADPSVRRDLEAYFERIVPESAAYEHDTEGPDDMPAHIRTALTQTHLAIPVVNGELALGTWQGIYLFEHRRAPHTRELVLHLVGE